MHYPRPQPLKFYQHFASFALRKITIFLHLKSSNQTGHGFQFANCQITGGCLEQFQLVSGCRTIVRKVLSQLIVFLIQLLYHIIPIKATSAAPHWYFHDIPHLIPINRYMKSSFSINIKSPCSTNNLHCSLYIPMNAWIHGIVIFHWYAHPCYIPILFSITPY